MENHCHQHGGNGDPDVEDEKLKLQTSGEYIKYVGLAR